MWHNTARSYRAAAATPRAVALSPGLSGRGPRPRRGRGAAAPRRSTRAFEPPSGARQPHQRPSMGVRRIPRPALHPRDRRSHRDGFACPGGARGRPPGSRALQRQRPHGCGDLSAGRTAPTAHARGRRGLAQVGGANRTATRAVGRPGLLHRLRGRKSIEVAGGGSSRCGRRVRAPPSGYAGGSHGPGLFQRLEGELGRAWGARGLLHRLRGVRTSTLALMRPAQPARFGLLLRNPATPVPPAARIWTPDGRAVWEGPGALWVRRTGRALWV